MFQPSHCSTPIAAATPVQATRRAEHEQRVRAAPYEQRHCRREDPVQPELRRGDDMRAPGVRPRGEEGIERRRDDPREQQDCRDPHRSRRAQRSEPAAHSTRGGEDGDGEQRAVLQLQCRAERERH